MARPKKSDAIDIQDRAVTEVIAQLRDGTHTFSLNTIAKKIGCSAPALYAYFSSKDDLLDHVRQQAFKIYWRKNSIDTRNRHQPILFRIYKTAAIISFLSHKKIQTFIV